MNTTLRMTPQTKLVLGLTQQMGHATNLQILQSGRKTFTSLSPTTVHRITKRLIGHGLLAAGPELNGANMVDANLEKHDHFVCAACDGIKDVKLGDKVLKEIEKQTGAQVLPASLVIFGDCQRCSGGTVKKNKKI